MFIIWRGLGIIVPIVLGISLWITSYSFEDVRLGNTLYVGWSLFWAGIFVSIFSLFFLSNKQSNDSQTDEYGNPVESKGKKYNDFFWMPLWVWGLAFVGISLFFIYGMNPSESVAEENVENTDINLVDDTDEVVEEEEVETRPLYLYNCAADSIHIKIREKKADFDLFDFYVRTYSYEYAYLPLGKYTVYLDEITWDMTAKRLTKRERTEYDGLWMILCADMDFVLVEVTDVCQPNMKAQAINAIDWMDKVVERYDGNKVISPKIRTKSNEEFRLIGPNVYLPQTFEENQTVYSLIPISANKELTEDFLDSELNYLYEFEK